MHERLLGALAALVWLLAVVPAAAADPTTLNIDLQSDADFIDPALDYYQLGWQIEYATCAKLVNFADRDGQAGAVLQPEVALTLPVVSDGGTDLHLPAARRLPLRHRREGDGEDLRARLRAAAAR